MVLLISLKSFASRHLVLRKQHELCERSCKSNPYVHTTCSKHFISKYGNVHRQIRALVILDALIQNAGTRFQKAFADEPLLERLRILARDDTVDADVRQKANVLFRGWAVAYKGTPGLERIAALHKELPRTKRPQPQQSRIVRQQDAEAAREREDNSPSPPRNRRPEPQQASSSRTS